MIILGLSINHPNSSCSIIVNGVVVYSAEEERFDRIKNSDNFPINSILNGLKLLDIRFEDIHAIAVNSNFNYNLLNKFVFSTKNFINNTSSFYLKTIQDFNNFIFSNKFIIKKQKYNFLFDKMKKIKIYSIPHHISHISNAYFTSGFNDAIGYSYDGSGDFSCVESYKMKKKKIKLLNKVLYPNSLGIFYQMFSQLAGFIGHGDEYKFMGLVAMGKPRNFSKLSEVIDYDNENIYINKKYLNFNNLFKYNKYFQNGIKIYNNNLEDLFNIKKKDRISYSEKLVDLAASVQKKFEEIILHQINYLFERNDSKNLLLSGGCAFNAIANTKILERTKFKKIFIGPNPGDAGGSAGAALYLFNELSSKFVNRRLNNSFIGNKYTTKEISNAINIYNKNKYKILHIKNISETINITTKLLVKNKIVGWHQDRMEWGPRSLGNRCILSRPDKLINRIRLNKIIKNREKFRPFAASILYDHQKNFFENNVFSPFMNYVIKIKKSKIKQLLAAAHHDQTSRVQSVDKKHNLKFYKLIYSFYKKTNIPCLLNTSLNNQEPICESPEHAIKLFHETGLDALILNNYILLKK